MALPRPDFTNLPPFEKNFYIEHPAVAARSPAEIEAYRRDKAVSAGGADCWVAAWCVLVCHV